MAKTTKRQLVINNAVAVAAPTVIDQGAAAAVLTPDHYEELTFNLDTGVKVTNATLEGRNYTVVPTVMITEGVHEGSNGPLYYPAEELSKTPAVWNHKPIVVYHPTLNGAGISACEHVVLEKRKIGILMNTRYVAGTAKGPGKLCTECWLETDRMPLVDERVSAAVTNKKMMEVSTGLFLDTESTDGIWGKKNTPYENIARNYRPDHLAVLPDQKGACSVADGAGLLRNSARQSHDELRGKLRDAVRARKQGVMSMGTGGDSFDRGYVEDVFDKFCVYSQDGKSYKQNYTVDKNGDVTLMGLPDAVIRRLVYQTSDGKTVNAQGDSAMDKKAMIAALISNVGLQLTEADRPMLEGMTEIQLAKFLPPAGATTTNAAPAQQQQATQQQQTPPPAQQQQQAAPAQQQVANTAVTAPKVPTLDEYIQNASPEYRDVIISGLQAHNTEKARRIAVITENAACPFTKEELGQRSLAELDKMARLVQLNKPRAQQPTMNYAGMADAYSQQVTGTEPVEALELPTMNFSREAATAK